MFKKHRIMRSNQWEVLELPLWDGQITEHIPNGLGSCCLGQRRSLCPDGVLWRYQRRESCPVLLRKGQMRRMTAGLREEGECLPPWAGRAGGIWWCSGLGIDCLVLHGGSGRVDSAAGNIQWSQGLFNTRGSNKRVKGQTQAVSWATTCRFDSLVTMTELSPF